MGSGGYRSCAFGVDTGAKNFSLQATSLNRWKLHVRHPRAVAVRAETVDGKRLVDVVISGAGPAGLAAALALSKTGWKDIVLLEESDKDGNSGTALGLWTNAWKALDALGVGDVIRQSGAPRVDKVEVCREDGDRVLRSFNLDECANGPHEFRGVTRKTLVDCLIGKIPPDVHIKYGKKVVNCKMGDQGATVTTSDGDQIICNLLIGADGVRSSVAMGLGKKSQRDFSVNYVGQIAIRGVASYSGAVPCNSIRQIWGPSTRAGVYPVSDNELYWYVCFNDDGRSIMGGQKILEEAKNTLISASGKTWQSSVVWDAIQQTSSERVSRSRLADRWDLSSLLPSANSLGDVPVALVGDALHPMTPNLGQGGCTALEDGVVLARVLRQSGALAAPAGRSRQALITGALQKYNQERARRCVPLVVRSNLMGYALQTGLWPVVAARDTYVSAFFNPSHFLDHAAFDCGTL
jgi:2-polyprenyl-6-methoxyphenol hydroxylase-like FAD-dependent oxidoreductase